MAEELIEIGRCGNGATYEVDNRLRFEDGRLFVTKTPYVGGKQSDFPEKVDVTEEVLDMLLKNLEKPKKNFRERYKRIAESESFKKAHEGMSIGEVIPIEGEEPVSEELEKAAWLYYDKNRLPIPPEWNLHKEFIDFFKAGANWQKQKIIDKACEYLDLHCNEVKTEDNGIAGWIDNKFINNLKQAMKDE